MLREKFIEIEEKLLSELLSFYGKRLVSVVLFGSAARETQRFDSDIDLLVIATGLPDGRMQRVREFEQVEDSMEPLLKQMQMCGINTYISAVIKSPDEALSGSPLFLDMVEDAKILFDRDGFFSSVLEKLKKRLVELGARRIWKGSAWYWDLKPDYRHGDVIEL